MASNGHQWNGYQEAIFLAVSETIHNLVIEALAGTGKTTTIIECLQRIDSSLKTIFVAFNKSIQQELQSRCPPHVDCKTLHSVGYGTVIKHAGKFTVDSGKTGAIAKRVLDNMRGQDPAPKGVYAKGITAAVCKLVGLCKNLLEHDPDGIEKVCRRYAVGDETMPVETLVTAAAATLQGCAGELATIDFDDMVWLPGFHGWVPKRYDVVFVDEAQDINPAQLYLIEQMARPVRGRKGRVIAVGDDRQAIYGFRGAGTGVLGQLTAQFKADTHTLPVTYRCGSAIVDVAREIVPEYEADPCTGAGVVRSCKSHEVDAKPGDFILSRINAPLVSMCLSMLKRKIPAVIAGRDIAAGLRKLVEQSEADTIAALETWLAAYSARMVRKYNKEDDARRLEEILDRVECLRAIMEDFDSSQSAAMVTRHLDRLFGDREATDMVVLSSVHRAKGLERDRVWALADTFRQGRGIREEDNIYYVACTRAKSELVFVRD